jgi:hypothetical protein
VAKRALLIGSQTFGLTGVNSDVALMRGTLEGRGFSVTELLDGSATRDEIIHAYEKLIRDTPRGSVDPYEIVDASGEGMGAR